MFIAHEKNIKHISKISLSFVVSIFSTVDTYTEDIVLKNIHKLLWLEESASLHISGIPSPGYFFQAYFSKLQHEMIHLERILHIKW